MLSPEEYANQIRRLLQQGEHQTAANLLREGFTHYPTDGDLWKLFGMALVTAKEYSRAVIAFSAAATQGPLDPTTRRAYAEAIKEVDRGEKTPEP